MWSRGAETVAKPPPWSAWFAVIRQNAIEVMTPEVATPESTQSGIPRSMCHGGVPWMTHQDVVRLGRGSLTECHCIHVLALMAYRQLSVRVSVSSWRVSRAARRSGHDPTSGRVMKRILNRPHPQCEIKSPIEREAWRGRHRR